MASALRGGANTVWSPNGALGRGSEARLFVVAKTLLKRQMLDMSSQLAEILEFGSNNYREVCNGQTRHARNSVR
jgi:hypothetical protein